MQVVEVYTDPACPWTWITSRWLREVAPQRDLELRWPSYCLEIRDEGEIPPGMSDEVRHIAPALRAESHRVLRVFEALRADEGEGAVDALYTEWGRRVFVPGPPAAPAPQMLADCLRACGLAVERDRAGDDPSWDAAIIRSMEIAHAFGGAQTKTPTLVLSGDPPRGLTGPVMSPAPTGDAALRLWDAVRVLADEPGFLRTHPTTADATRIPAVRRESVSRPGVPVAEAQKASLWLARTEVAGS